MLVFFRTRLCLYKRLAGFFRDLFTNHASNGAVRVRGGVIKSRHVVDNDTTVHVVHASTVLIKCSNCPHHQTLTRTP